MKTESSSSDLYVSLLEFIPDEGILATEWMLLMNVRVNM